MVHTGKPSRGCETCRKRRIKCDEAVPQCSYCVKKKKPCPGYKDLFDLAWRDQTKSAERSVQRRKRAYENIKVPMDYIYSERDYTSAEQIEVPIPLREYPKDHALCFFFTEYVLIPRDPQSVNGYMDELTPIFVKADLHSPVMSATSAVATCLLEAWLKKGPDTLLSRSSYLAAITAVREQVEQRKPFRVEEMLLAILLLDMYEGLVTTAKLQRGNGTHISGAVALIKQREVNSFQSESSQRLVLAVRSKLIENAIKTNQPLPQDLASWSGIVKDVPENAALRLDSINIDIANLLLIASKALPGDSRQPELNAEVGRVLEFAVATERRLATWPDTLPPSWTIRRVSSPELIPERVRAAGVYGGQCDIYANIFAASTWNSYRCSRIKVLSTITACLAQLPLEHNPQLLKTSKDTIQKLVDSVCASVPFHLGEKVAPERLDRKDIQFPQVSGVPLPRNHYRVAGAVGGFFLLGALFCVTDPQLPLREGQRGWIAGQLQRVIKIYNIQRRD